MDENSSASYDVLEQQFDILSQWSRFYHEAEIKLNSSSVIISAIAVAGDKLSGDSYFIMIFGAMINPRGIIIIIASVVGLISTLGYWRYYEYCDMLGKYYRTLYIQKATRDEIKKEI